jgi:hypothetical protein
MLCGGFSESKSKRLTLDDVDGGIFIKALDVWLGKEDFHLELGEVQHLALVADRFQMYDVLSVLEEALIGQLDMEMCGEFLVWSRRFGMQLLEAAALTMAAKRFEKFVLTAGFMRIGEEELGILIDNDRLVARNEETVWEAVVGWTKSAAGGMRRRGVLGKIRFPLMAEEYLACRVEGMVDGEDADWMKSVVAEAQRAKAARREGAVFEFELLGQKALLDRVGLGVRWEEYMEGQELRLRGHRRVTSIAACDGRVCSGADDGSIRVWSRASGEYERTLLADASEVGSNFHRSALAVWEDRLISGHGSGKLQVWNVATGECDQVFEGHNSPVFALAVCGSRLAVGFLDGRIEVWAKAAGALWVWERRLPGHRSGVCSLAGWQDKLASGSDDPAGSIRVWDLGTGALEAKLAGLRGPTWALVVHGDRLFSASFNAGGPECSIQAWALGTWAGLRTLEVRGQGEGQFVCSLAVSGSKLVGGFRNRIGNSPAEVRVWGLEEFDLQQTLLQPANSGGVYALLAVDGEVWAGVGKEVVAWGRTQ